MTDQPTATVFRFERPEVKRLKKTQRLARTDSIVAIVQVVAKGGETNLHAHPHLDGVWYVLSGRARFYASEDELIAELGPHEGVLIPKGCAYWFESAGDEQLEILQVE